MSFLGIHILNDTKFHEMKAALEAEGHTVVASATASIDQTIATLKTTEIGKAAANAISAAEEPGLTGAQKFEKAVASTLPTIVDYASKGGVSAAIKDVEDIGRQIVQSVFNELKSTTAPSVATSLLSIALKAL